MAREGDFLLFLRFPAGVHEPLKIVDVLHHDPVGMHLDPPLRNEVIEHFPALPRGDPGPV